MTREIEKGMVSTIIPVFNRPQMVVEAINSVLQQDYRPIEIIVVDDGSTDNTFAVLNSLAEAQDELKVYQQANLGPGVARELGIQNARGEFIQYLDSDDMLLPQKFSYQVSSLRQNPDCGVAYGKTEVQIVAAPRSAVAWKRTGEKIAFMFPSFLRERWWGTSTPLYRHALLKQIGPWCPMVNEEDWEYDCRVAALGTKLTYVDKFVSIQRRHNEHLSNFGTSDPEKLKSRCIARQKIFESVQNSRVLIPQGDIEHFSKSVFLLARECAMAGLKTEVSKMLKLAIKANGKANYKHRIFSLIGRTLGWQAAVVCTTMLRK